MPELGSKSPKFPEEPCWGIMCPVLYCSANPGCSCMNAKGAFSRTHKMRREVFERKQTQNKTGPGAWNDRPVGEMEARSRFERDPSGSDIEEFF